MNLFGEVDVSSADKVIELNDRQSCDTQLLCNGGFSPLTGFMTEEEYNAVVTDMRLPSGLIMGECSCLPSDLFVLSFHGSWSSSQVFRWSWTPSTTPSRRVKSCCSPTRARIWR